MSYQILEHTADLKIGVQGKSLENLFAEVVLAMMDLMKPENFQEQGNSTRRKISIKSLDETTLLIDFMSEILLQANINKEIYTKITFKEFSSSSLGATLEGASVSEFNEDIKAVTYHEADIKKVSGGTWETIIVFDV